MTCKYSFPTPTQMNPMLPSVLTPVAMVASPNLLSTGHNTDSTHTHNTGGTGGGGSNNSKYNNILGPTHNSQQQNNQHIYGRHYNINNNNINSNNNLNTSGYTSKFDANGNIIYSA
eukprot:95856_1